MIAFYGMGLLGSNFVRALRRRGETVRVWNRSAEKARALAAEGAVPFDDPAAFFSDVEQFAAKFVPGMHAIDPATYIEFDHLSSLPGFDTPGDSEITALGKVCNATHDFGKVSFASEASLFHNAAIPAVLCGPGHIAQAHQPNEWVGLDQLARCEAFLRRLGDRLCVA